MDRPQVGLLRWLLEGDPAVRWRVLRDLTDAADGRWTAASRGAARL